MIDPTARFDAGREKFQNFLHDIESYADDFARIGENRPPEPRWDQVWFPRLDACAAYTMVRDRKPARIVEIGSGHSTRFMARAIRDGHLTTKLTSVDPEPRATIQGLPVEWNVQRVQDAVLPELSSGDILFIDSSHILSPGSDVEHLIDHILPALPAGAIVHFHDIFLPGPYPAEWAYRRYNEQDAVSELLVDNGFTILFASHYAAKHLVDDIEQGCIARLPLDPRAIENSLWLEKR